MDAVASPKRNDYRQAFVRGQLREVAAIFSKRFENGFAESGLYEALPDRCRLYRFPGDLSADALPVTERRRGRLGGGLANRLGRDGESDRIHHADAT
jgi:hypothetical protein